MTSTPRVRCAASGVSWLAVVGVTSVVVALSAGGCRGHTAAGCAAGTAVGMLITGVSAAAADDPSLDIGSVLLGGGLIGLGAGCTGAATVDAMMGGQQDKTERRPPPEPLYPARAARQPQPSHGRAVVMAAVELDGLRVLWVANPERYPTKVGLRFERYAREPVLVDCTALELVVDGRSLRFDLTGKAAPQGQLVLEKAQSTVSIDVIREMRQALAVEFHLCGLRRRLTTKAGDTLASFVQRFDALAPASTATAEAGPATATAVEPSLSSGASGSSPLGSSGSSESSESSTFEIIPVPAAPLAAPSPPASSATPPGAANAPTPPTSPATQPVQAP